MKIVESVSWRDTFSTNPIFLKLWKVSLQETPSVWLSLLPKIKFFLWLVITDVLPTCEFLIVRRMKITNMCHFLNQNSENIDHIFKYCPFVKKFGITLSIIVLHLSCLSCTKVTSYLDLKWCIQIIKLTIKISIIRWKICYYLVKCMDS